MSYKESGSKEVEIEVEIRGNTDLAYKVFNGKAEAWIPRSQISDRCEENGVITSIFIPEWLAEEKGLV